MLLAIIACEIGFWVFIALGLLARYPLNMPRLGLAFFIATPIVDLALLGFTVAHLHSGAEPHVTHGLAAIYIGFSIVFGHGLINSADRAYRRRIRKEKVAPAVQEPGMRKELRSFGKAILASAIAIGVLEIAILAAGTPEATEVLRSWHGRLATVLVIWGLTGPVWQMFATSPARSAHAQQ